MDALLATAALASFACSASDGKKSSSDDKGHNDSSDNRHETSGYAVVDPVPSPSRCGLAAAPEVTATATGVKRADGKWDVTIEFHVAPGGEKIELKRLSGAWSPNFAAEGTFTPTADGGTAVVTVDASSGSVKVSIEVVCGTEHGFVSADVMWKVDHLKDSPYPVTISASGW